MGESYQSSQCEGFSISVVHWEGGSISGVHWEGGVSECSPFGMVVLLVYIVLLCRLALYITCLTCL